MIGTLRGILRDKQPPALLLEVAGVGYELEAPVSTFCELPALGQEVRLHTHLILREDGAHLYGFVSLAEKSLFRALIRVNGVGPKLALVLLSGITVEGFMRCVQERDIASLMKLPGVGRKTAERLLIELQDRLQDLSLPGITLPVDPVSANAASTPADEAYRALVALGYKPQEAQEMVRKTAQEDMSSEQILRQALRTALK